MEDQCFRKLAILLKKREEARLGKLCTNIFKNSENLISTLHNTTSCDNESLSVLNSLLSNISYKFESIV